MSNSTLLDRNNRMAIKNADVAPVDANKAKRGRPVTGKAKTATERVKSLDSALIENGGRILNRVRLSSEAADALASLSKSFGSDRSAIENSLTFFAKNAQKRCAQR